MLIARNKFQKTVIADTTSDFYAPFFCIGCRKKIFLHNEKNQKFFSHFPGDSCHYSNEDSIIVKSKIELFNAIQEQKELEKIQYNLLSNISTTFHDKKISICFFTTKTKIETIQNKIQVFSKNDIYSLWLMPYDLFQKELTKGIFYATENDLFVYKTYIQKMFLYSNDKYIIPITFELQHTFQKDDKKIFAMKPIYHKPRSIEHFFPKEEHPYKGQGFDRKLYTLFIKK